MKKKKLIIAIIISIIIISIILSTILIYKAKRKEENLVLDIKKSYSKYATLSKGANLYTKEKKVIGTINDSIDVTLDKTKVKTSEDKYYKINNTEYYVLYKDISKTKEYPKEEMSNKYIMFNKNIQTDKKVELYKNGNLFLTINKQLNLPLLYLDEEYYYTTYLDKILAIKKDNNITLIDSQNTEEKETDYISIINFNNIKDQNTCNTTNCLSIDKIKEQLNYIKNNNYYPITIDEYEKWLNGNLRLKEKAILLTTNIESETLNGINNEYNMNIQPTTNSSLKFIDNNKRTDKQSIKDSLSRYNIKNNTSLEQLKKMLNGEEVKEYIPVQQQKIAVLNYHFFYDSSLGESCNESICLEVKNFREQLDYLKNNGYKTLKIEEFKAWMYGEMDLPEKSVLITIDDGAMGTGRHNGHKLIPILEEYNMTATLFLIAGWWNIENYQSPNLQIQSHTYDMHQYGSCGKGQAVCATKEELVEDLKKSLQIIGDNTSFCFPFYNYSNTAIQGVKDVGFKLAFIGGNRKATRNDDKFKIPRYPIYKNTTMQQFISMVK